MAEVKYILSSLAVLSFILLIAGLIRPVYVIWWMARQNRVRVIKLYGLLLTVFLTLWWLMRASQPRIQTSAPS